jgi:WD40 repeat protein
MPATGECAAVVKAKGPVYAVAVAPDGKTFVYAGRYAPQAESNFVYACDLAGAPVRRFELRTEGYIALRNAATGEIVQTVGSVPRSIWSLSFSSDGQYLAAACRVQGGGNIPDGGGGFYWQLASAGNASPLAADSYTVAFAPIGTQYAATRQNLVEFRELTPAPGESVLAPKKPVHQIDTTQSKVSYQLTVSWSPVVAFVPETDLAVVAAGAFVYFVNPTRQNKPIRLKTGIRTVAALAASPDGKTILVGGRPGMIEVYDTLTRTTKTTYDFGIGSVHSLAFAPDGLTFAAGGDRGLVVCDVAS